MGFFDKGENNIKLDNSTNTYTVDKNVYLKLVSETKELKSQLIDEVTKNDLLITEITGYKNKIEELIKEIVDLKVENKFLKEGVNNDK